MDRLFYDDPYVNAGNQLATSFENAVAVVFIAQRCLGWLLSWCTRPGRRPARKDNRDLPSGCQSPNSVAAGAGDRQLLLTAMSRPRAISVPASNGDCLRALCYGKGYPGLVAVSPSSRWSRVRCLPAQLTGQYRVDTDQYPVRRRQQKRK